MGARVPVAVLGATGYTGVELLRLLVRHPGVELTFLSSQHYRDRPVAEVHPFLEGVLDARLRAVDPDAIAECSAVVFTALPHASAAPVVRELLQRGRRVLDLSADFRLRDAAVYARWYGSHPAPDLLREAV
jgi:N-acetyl-gamma-glutamyl-phosphate reductase